MRWTRVVYYALMGVLLVMTPYSVQGAETTYPAPPVLVRRVLLLSIDGLRPDAVHAAGAVNMLGLAAGGAATWEANTVLPSVTLPAHASMLTGLDAPEHGVVDNDSIYPCPVLPAPTFITMAQAAGYRTAMIVGKERMCRLHQADAVDYTFARMGDRSVADRAIQLLDEGYEVIFAHFPNVDQAGHTTGWMSAEYLYSVANTDREIGRVLTHLDTLGVRDQTLVLLTSDHGGHEFRHGSDMPEDRLIPWIIAGPGVVPGVTLGADVSVTDTADTLLWALGLPPTVSAISQPRLDAFGLPIMVESVP